MSTSGPHDAAFDAIYKQCATHMGGDLKFVDAFFGFLARKTPLLRNPAGVEQVQGLAMKHVDGAKQIAATEAAEKKKKEAADAKAAAEKSTAAAAAAASAPAAAAASSSSAAAAATPVTELKDADEESTEEDALPVPIDNGGVTDKYRWSQTLAETNVSVPLPKGTTSKQIKVVIEANKLYAALTTGEKTVFIDGEPDEKIDTQDATWTLEEHKGEKSLEIYLPKANKMSWWKSLVQGGPRINTKKIVPENSKLDDLDGDTRGTVEKMMFDQRQKQMGKPSSDEMQKQAALQRFMAMHPEMDFSQVGHRRRTRQEERLRGCTQSG